MHAVSYGHVFTGGLAVTAGAMAAFDCTWIVVAIDPLLAAAAAPALTTKARDAPFLTQRSRGQSGPSTPTQAMTGSVGSGTDAGPTHVTWTSPGRAGSVLESIRVNGRVRSGWHIAVEERSGFGIVARDPGCPFPVRVSGGAAPSM